MFGLELAQQLLFKIPIVCEVAMNQQSQSKHGIMDGGLLHG